MDWLTFKKVVSIRKKYTDISGMSQKNFRKISRQEQDISLYLSNFSKEVAQLTDILEIWLYLNLMQNCRVLPLILTDIFNFLPEKGRQKERKKERKGERKGVSEGPKM